MIKIIMNGCNGKMGQVISKLISEADDMEIICGIDINNNVKNTYPVYPSISDFEGQADVIIDFSHPSTLSSVLQYAQSKKTPAIIATTGLSAEQKDEIKNASQDVAMFFSANMSLGINLIIDLVSKAAKILEENFDIEIIEKHHNQKIDAPSGTALAIADAISASVKIEPEYTYDRHSVRKKRGKNEIGIHSLRGGTIVGEHAVIFAGQDEIIEIKHQATSKEIFAVGAVRAAKFIAGKKPGLYSMNDLISEK
ncbi:MAG: 4-hydroxy-tetrahydrodipicolinate reductase [Clostridia bacterium]|nr:4-hydroxy-tetrahydrodipicolinate reductase [Clostridia bacterium]